MTCPAVRESGQLFNIPGRPLAVTIQTPTHIHDLWVFGNRHLGHIAMTLLTVQSGRDMRPMGEMHKIWNLSDRHPGNFLIVQHKIL
jgi:hypothetical protein